MRGVGAIVGLGFGLAMTQMAVAADYWPLRGSTYDPPKQRDWSGFYAGGQVGTGGGGANFSGEGEGLTAHILRNTLLESEAGVSQWVTSGRGDTGQALQYGAFVGYNFQWDDVVFGVEASYNHTKLSATDYGEIHRIVTLSNDFQYYVTSGSGSTIQLMDFATIRGRAGWAVGSFLPYVTGGLALGRANYLTVATVSYPAPTYIGSTTPAPTLPAVDQTESVGKSNALIYGFSAGLGVDWALTDNVFLRGEYEFIQFSQMKLNLNNARVGLGLKF